MPVQNVILRDVTFRRPPQLTFLVPNWYSSLGHYAQMVTVNEPSNAKPNSERRLDPSLYHIISHYHRAWWLPLRSVDVHVWLRNIIMLYIHTLMYIYLYIYYKNILFKPCLCVLHILSMHMDSHPDHCLIINLLHLFRAYLTVPLWQADLGSKQLPVLKQKVLLGSCAFRFIQTCGTTQGEDREQWNFSGWSWVKFWFSLGAEIMEVS